MPSSPSESRAAVPAQSIWEEIRSAYDPSGSVKAQIRRNQLLPLHWRHLTDGDMWQIATLLWAEPSSEVSEIELEAMLAIAAILTTGRSLERLHGLKLYENTTPSEDGNAREGLALKDGNFSWNLISVPPSRQDDLDEASEEPAERDGTTRSQERKKVRELQIPAAPIVVARLQHCDIELCGLPSRLFKHEIGSLATAIENILKTRRGTGVTPPRRCSRTLESITRFLTLEMVHQAGSDIATAARLTDSDHPLAESPTYYGAYKSRDPGKRMRKATTRLDKAGSSDILIEGEEQTLGSFIAPTESQVKYFIKHLKKGLYTGKTPDDRHKAMLIQTVALVSFATGHRCLGKYLPSTAAIDEDTGFCRINEKSPRDKTETRMVWVCQEARDQIAHYERHIDALKPHIFLPRQFEMLQFHVSAGRLPIFKLSAGSVDRCTIESIWNSFHTDYPRFRRIPKNAGRHWLRSNLEGKCSTETLHALFGHGQIGGEPWSYGSCLDPLLYRADLERTIPQLFINLEWKALPSSLVTDHG